MKQALIPFHGTTIATFEMDGEVFVAMRPIVEAIGLAWQGQLERLKRHPVLKSCVSVTLTQLPGDRQKREYVVLPLEFLHGWLFTVSAERAKPEVRDRLVEYQRECFHVLDAYWRKGVAANPRLRTIVETQMPSDGVGKRQGERFAEERRRFEVREEITLEDALKGHGVASPATIRSIEQRDVRIKEKLAICLLRMGFDMHYIFYGERTLTDAERAMRDTYRLTDERHRALMLAMAEQAPLDVVEMVDANGETVGYRSGRVGLLNREQGRLLN